MRLIVSILGILVGSFAFSQDVKPFPDPDLGMGLASRPLLEEPAVQKEIQLTPKQRNQLSAVAEEMSAIRQGLSNPLPDQGEFDFQQMMAKLEISDKQQQNAQSKILTVAQKKRLRQIEWQREGYLALSRKEIASDLKLTEGQRREIEDAITRLRSGQMNSLFSNPQPAPKKPANKPATIPSPSNGFAMPAPAEGFLPPQADSENFQSRANQSIAEIKIIRRSTFAEIEKVLTPAQKSTFISLLGPAFDFSSISTSTPRLAEPIQNPSGGISRSRPLEKRSEKGGKDVDRDSRKSPKR